MKFINNRLAVICLSGSFLLSSCEAIQNSNNEQRGTSIGVAAGAVIGGILGNNIGHGKNSALGAVLGGIIGGVAGNAIGKKMDNQAKQIKEALPGAEVERVNEGIKITFHESVVNFGFDSSNLTPSSEENLAKLAKVLKEQPNTNISIYGHTDSKGSDDYNLKLSERRANSVVNYLNSLGISLSRMTPKGMGETEPIATNDTPEGRAKNRRVEFAITANEKMIQEAQQNAN